MFSYYPVNKVAFVAVLICVCMFVPNKLHAQTSGVLPDTISVCDAESVTLDAGAGYANYQWSTGETTQSINVNIGGLYRIILTDTAGGMHTDSIWVSLIHSTINPNDTLICGGSELTLSTPLPAYTADSIAGLNYLGFFEGSYYYISADTAGWGGANVLANAAGGHMLTIGSSAENAFIVSHVEEAVWTGLFQADSLSDFEWVTGEPVTYTNWAMGEPNNFGGIEDFAELLEDGTWNDIPQNVFIRYIVEIEGGPVLTYAWSGGQTTQGISIMPTVSSSYMVTVSDGTSLCTDSVQIIVETPAVELMATDPICPEFYDGSITVSATGTGLPYTYNWSNGSTGPNLTGLSDGNYLLSLTTSGGCPLDTLAVLDSDPMLLSIVTVSPSGPGINDGSALLSIAGGQAPFDIFWTTGDTVANADNLYEGTYSVGVFDANGCYAWAEVDLQTGCPVPGMPQAATMSGTVQMSWVASPSHQKFQIQGRALGAPSFSLKKANSSPLTISGLAAGTYEWQVRARCFDGSLSDFSALNQFTIPLLRNAQLASEGFGGGFSLDLWPNPTVDAVNLSWELPQSESVVQPTTIMVLDLQGRIVRNLDVTGISVAKIDELPAGIYIVELKSGEIQEHRRLVVF